MTNDLPAQPVEKPHRWSYQGAADPGGVPKEDLAYRVALLIAALADAAAFSTVVQLVMRDQPAWQAWLLVAGLTTIALMLAHLAGRLTRDDAAAHGRISWQAVTVCAGPWFLLGIAAVWVRMRLSAPSGGITFGAQGSHNAPDRLAAALLFLVLYIASGAVAGVGEFLTRNPLRSAYRGLLKAYQKAQRRLARTQPRYERAIFVRQLHLANFEEDDEVLLNAKQDRIAYGEELKQFAQISIAAHLQDPSATDGMTERDWRPANGSRIRLVDPPSERRPGRQPGEAA